MCKGILCIIVTPMPGADKMDLENLLPSQQLCLTLIGLS